MLLHCNDNQKLSLPVSNLFIRVPNKCPALRKPCWAADERGAAAEEEALGAPGVRAHRRGMSSYVFVPLHRLDDHELNLPVSKMDFYIPS